LKRIKIVSIGFLGVALLFLPAGAVALFQQSVEAAPSAISTFLVTFLPIALIFGVYIWFMRRSGVGENKEYMQRSRAYMDRTERQNDQIIAALERIEKALEQRR
jgi:hypothetical protein